jgi:hypothetical protein
MATPKLTTITNPRPQSSWQQQLHSSPYLQLTHQSTIPINQAVPRTNSSQKAKPMEEHQPVLPCCHHRAHHRLCRCPGRNKLFPSHRCRRRLPTSSPAFKSPVTSQPCRPRAGPLKLSRCSSHSYDLLSLCGEENEKKERRIEK